MAAVELHVNATYAHVQHWMKSVYVKSQPVIDVKLFSFLQVSELAQGLQNFRGMFVCLIYLMSVW